MFPAEIPLCSSQVPLAIGTSLFTHQNHAANAYRIGQREDDHRGKIYDRYPEVVFSSHREIKCVFLTVVVRTAALKKKYRGDIKRFVEGYYNARCNMDLARVCAMGWQDIEEPIEKLNGDGLVLDVYNAYFDATFEALIRGKGQDVELPVSWLKGYRCGERMKICYNG